VSGVIRSDDNASDLAEVSSNLRIHMHTMGASMVKWP
jgi:hypothetical protein